MDAVDWSVTVVAELALSADAVQGRLATDPRSGGVVATVSSVRAGVCHVAVTLKARTAAEGISDAEAWLQAAATPVTDQPLRIVEARAINLELASNR